MNTSAFFSYLKTKIRKITPNKMQIVEFCLIVFFLNFFFVSSYPRNSHTRCACGKLGIKSTSLQSFENHSRIVIQDAGGFQNWPGSGTRDDPYVIEGLEIIDDTFCIYITYTSVHFVIKNCYFESSINAARTVLFDNIANGIIANCTIKSGGYGIEIDECANCTIINCTINDSDFGIYLNAASNITLDGNQVFRNPTGIRVDNSTACTIVHNRIYRNAIRGIFLNYYTNNCTLYNNLIGWNRGFLLDSTEQNAYDNGGSNLWDDNMSQGNYWSDWDSDGPYEIDGIVTVYDRYPSLLIDNEIPIISHPEDVSYDQGTVNNTIMWNGTDEYPCFYRIYLDDMRIIEETWNGQMIVLNIDNLPSGTYNYTILVSDPLHTTSDVVIVRVYIDILSDIAPELLIASSFLSVVCVVLVLSIIKYIR